MSLVGGSNSVEHVNMHQHFTFLPFPHLHFTFFVCLLIPQKRQTSMGCYCMRANERAAVCLKVNIWTSEWAQVYLLVFFFVCARVGVLCWLWLCWLWTRYQVTLVIVECVDKNNETFANRDSVGPLKGLRWGLTVPEDIASDQEGRWKRMKSRERACRPRVSQSMSPISFYTTQTCCFDPKKTLQLDKTVYK